MTSFIRFCVSFLAHGKCRYFSVCPSVHGGAGGGGGVLSHCLRGDVKFWSVQHRPHRVVGWVVWILTSPVREWLSEENPHLYPPPSQRTTAERCSQ